MTGEETFCEMCGAPIRGKAYKVSLEGATLVLCGRCYAKVMSAPGSALPLQTLSSRPERMHKQVNRKSKTLLRRPKHVEYEVVDDYAQRIREARERMGWSIAALAQRVMEKESVLRRIEAGRLRPTIDLAMRIERVLGVKLLEPVAEEEQIMNESGTRMELTLGDMANIRIKGKKR